MPTRVVSLAIAVAALVHVGLPRSAAAQATTAFSLDRFEPSERGSDWFILDSLDLRGHGRPAVGLVGEWGYKPLVLYDAAGNEQSVIVRHQLFTHLGGAIVLWDSLRLAVNLPIAAYKTGESDIVGTTAVTSPRSTAVGDLRVAATYRLVGEYRAPFTMALGVPVFLPTGKPEGYSGDGKARVAPHLAAAGAVGSFVYASRLGVQFRPTAGQNFRSATGTELEIAVSVGLRALDDRLVVGPELFGSSVLSEGDAFLSRRATPFEAFLGAHYAFPGGVRIGLGGGPGLTRGLGTPQIRLAGSLEWMPEIEPPPPPPSDRDSDGITDAIDACPNEPGLRSEDPKKNGCPKPRDSDGDGIVDQTDACPAEPGLASDVPEKNGCPLPPDRDRDGIVDAQDACPEEPGVRSDDPKKNGCPLPKDRDGDGILDEQDACPAEPGVASEDPKRHGCPRAIVREGQIRIDDQIKFATGKADLLPESEPILLAVAKVLTEHPEIKKLRVEGHTDNRAGRELNRKLSAARAASVVSWLVAHGALRERLVSQGFGPDRPIASNKTEEGRRDNRRVEFHIVEEGK